MLAILALDPVEDPASASELVDRAADLVSESATLVHDNERRWRVFRGRVEEISKEVPDQPSEEAR